MATLWIVLVGCILSTHALTVSNELFVQDDANFLGSVNFAQSITFEDLIHHPQNRMPIRIDHAQGVATQSWKFSLLYYYNHANAWPEAYTDLVAGVAAEYSSDPGGSKTTATGAYALADIDTSTPMDVSINGSTISTRQFVPSGTSGYAGQTFVIESFTMVAAYDAQGLLTETCPDQCALYVNNDRVMVSHDGGAAVTLLDIFANDVLHVVYASRAAATGLSLVYQHGFMDDMFASLMIYGPVPVSTTDFGLALALNAAGDIMAVGARSEASGGTARGGVTIYTRTATTWTLRDRIASDTDANIVAQDGANFGWAVDMDEAGTVLVVGAPLENAGGSSRGAVYVLTYNGSVWTVETRIAPGSLGVDPQDGMQFGYSVVMNGSANTMLVSAPYYDTAATDAGSVYYFTRFPSWVLDVTFNWYLYGGVFPLAAFNYLGISMSMNRAGDIVFFSAPGYNFNQGRVYLFKNTGTWGNIQTITGPTGSVGAPRFGTSLALCEVTDTLVVSSPEEDLTGTDRGEVYIYDPTPTWTLTQTVTPGVMGGIPTEDNAFFGFAVVCSGTGTDVLIAAPFENAGGTARGAVYALRYNVSVWELTQRITYTLNNELDPGHNARLGRALALSQAGDTAAMDEAYRVGYLSYDDHMFVYARSGNTWTNQQRVSRSLAVFNPTAQYGYSVATSDGGTVAVVGAPGESAGGTARGAAYIYTYVLGQWSLSAYLAADYDPFITISDGSYLGISVAISGDGTTMAVGCYKDAAGGIERGSVYTARHVASTWTLEKRLAGTQDSAWFGWDVALNFNGSTLLIGAPHEDTVSTNNGVAYVYVYVGGGSVWSLEQTISSVTFGGILSQNANFLGQSVALSASGDTAALGAPVRYQHGVVEILTRSGSTWTYQSIIERVPLSGPAPWYGEDYVFFGDHIALSADGLTLLVGGAFLDGAGTDRGSVYIYTYTGSWTEHTVLQPGVTSGIVVQDSAFFGSSMVMNDDGTECVVGAYKENAGGTERGAAYHFVLVGSTWIMETRYAADGAGTGWNTGASAQLGWDVDMNSRGLVAGQPAATYAQSSQGIAFVDVT